MSRFNSSSSGRLLKDSGTRSLEDPLFDRYDSHQDACAGRGKPNLLDLLEEAFLEVEGFRINIFALEASIPNIFRGGQA